MHIYPRGDSGKPDLQEDVEACKSITTSSEATAILVLIFALMQGLSVVAVVDKFKGWILMSYKSEVRQNSATSLFWMVKKKEKPVPAIVCHHCISS